MAHEIRCGNRTGHLSTLPEYHRTVEGVKRCYANTAFPCNWNVSVPTEDGPVIRECYDVSGAMAWENARGWECESGHEHVRDDVRRVEGWEYCEDDWDVKAVMAGGRVPVGMDGGSYTSRGF
jgi:hypothetical protein